MARTLLSTTLAAVAVLAAGCVSHPATPPHGGTLAGSSYAAPKIRHVFVVNLENHDYASSFGKGSDAPYLAVTLPGKGVLLTRYFGTAHHSLSNYLAQISGQGPSEAQQHDCGTYTAFRRTGTAAPGQAVGSGCVYPSSVRTLADQLEAHGFTWRAYMEDMGTACRHPALGAQDTTQQARRGDQYAVRHNPFMYFRSITGDKLSCARHVVGLGALPHDLQAVRTTRNLTYVTPNLCDDGHDSPCVDGRPGGLTTANTWLKRWIPKILASPAYRKNGLLVVTFDEAESGDATACCGEGAAPNAAQPGMSGPGGGRVGAVVVSRFVRAGTRSDRGYNHYALLRSMEDWFGLAHLGYARTARSFGADVFQAAP